jgi:ComF family protein
VDDVKLFDNLAVRRRAGGEIGDRGRQSDSADRAAVATREAVGRAHRAQIGDETRQARIAHFDPIRIGNGQREAGPAQEIAGRAHVDLRVDMGRGGAALRFVRGQHRRLEPRQAARTDKGAEEQAVRAERPPDQHQCAGQIVHAVKQADGDDEIEARIAEGQPIFVALHAAGCAGEPAARVGCSDPQLARPQRRKHSRLGDTQDQSLFKGSGHQPESLEQIISGRAKQIIGAADPRRGAIPALAPERAVERLVHRRGLVPGPCPVDKGGMEAALRLAQAATRQVVDFALPPRCPGCAAIVPDPHRFCLDCWQALDFLGEPCCRRCGLPFPYGRDEEAECAACLADPPAFDRLRAAVAYGEIARGVALKLKYGGRPGLAETLATLMQRHAGAGEVVLAPVPLHRWRIWRRGYNQSALIATALARRTGLAVELDLLERIKRTPPLKGLGRRERALAVRGAFRVPERKRAVLKGRTVILVDDVFTSGATAGACARALKRAGAGAVNILCWARVVREE